MFKRFLKKKCCNKPNIKTGKILSLSDLKTLLILPKGYFICSFGGIFGGWILKSNKSSYEMHIKDYPTVYKKGCLNCGTCHMEVEKAKERFNIMIIKYNTEMYDNIRGEEIERKLTDICII